MCASNFLSNINAVLSMARDSNSEFRAKTATISIKVY